MRTFLVEEVVNAAARGGQVESLWDEVLPGEVRELPEDLGGVGCAAARSGVVGADRGGLARRGAWLRVARRSRWDVSCG